jgi:hypothetical protein
MVLVKYDENGTPPPKAFLDAIAQFGREASAAGVMVARDGLQPSATGARIRLARGKVTTTDGPFAEAKEVIGGYAIYNVKSKQEAIDWASRFVGLHREHWPEWECEVEIRQILESA